MFCYTEKMKALLKGESLKKLLVSAVLILILQVLALEVAYKIAMSFMHSCTPIPGFLGWQCSGNVDPDKWLLISWIAIPPMLAKLLLKKVNILISWRKILLIHAVILLIVWSAVSYFDATSCGCGGA